MARIENQSPRSSGRNASNLSTMFVQADSSCNFRDIVQRLTGPSNPSSIMGPPQIPPPSPAPIPSSPKLHERRNYTKPRIEITRPATTTVGGFQFQPLMLQPGYPLSPMRFMSPRGGPFVPASSSCPASPSMPNVMLTLSPPCILNSAPTTPHNLLPSASSNNKRGSSTRVELNPVEEEKAIKEKRFYLHPSPRSRQKLGPEPELLTLFPLTSPLPATDKRKNVIVVDDESSDPGLRL